ncbi:acid-sensing ion channel 4 [Plakobranchus ocellatus]|uniref:Acid-sensing ion channel 4 n=1 Tax=Plakobranchus ocellatus TaxID=259542 RepID=A0AAV3XZM8_9GAST|nr:acid-sensing ion channel 4 [Plakobranchus ocellatus]
MPFKASGSDDGYPGDPSQSYCQHFRSSVEVMPMLKQPNKHHKINFWYDEPPICTLRQYLECYSKNIADVKVYVRDNCECPVPCDFLIYDPTISFASTSVYATERLLASTASQKLHQKYKRARETTARMDPLKFSHFRYLAAGMRSSLNSLRKVIEVSVRSRLEQQIDTLKSVYEEVNRVSSDKLYLVKWQKYHVDKNFVRARQAMEERTLMYLALGFQELSYQIESRIWQISHGPRSPEDNVTMTEDVRTGLFLDALDLINGRIDLADRAFANYTQLFGAFYNGTPIFRYKYEDEPRSENIYVTPRPLLNQSLYHNSYAAKYSRRVGVDINQFKLALEKYRTLLEKSYFQGNITDDEIHKNNIFFLSRGRVLYSSKSSFYLESIEYPSRILAVRIAELERRWRKFESNFQSMYGKVIKLTENLNYLGDTILGSLEKSVAEAEIYILHAHNSNINITKMEVARSLTSAKILKGKNELENFFDDIRSRGQSVYDDWSTLNTSTGDIWQLVLDDENLREFYEHRNLTEMLRDLTEVLTEVAVNFTQHRDDCDFRFELGNLDSLFLMSVEQMMDAMKAYITGSALDKDFIQNNFLQLDVYYKEKSYEQITQQRAYDLFALMCDIGGSMGLFVGASVLTICELLDLGLHKSVRHFAQTMNNPPR